MWCTGVDVWSSARLLGIAHLRVDFTRQNEARALALTSQAAGGSTFIWQPVNVGAALFETWSFELWGTFLFVGRFDSVSAETGGRV